MKCDEYRLPASVKMSVVLLGAIGFFYTIYLTQEVILPLVFSTFVAILLNPIVKFLERIKLHRVLAIFITLIFALVLMSVLIYFIWSQFSSFIEDFPVFRAKFNVALKEISNWLSSTLGVRTENMNNWISKRANGVMNNSELINNTLNAATRVFLSLFLIPVYIFFILFYEDRIIGFIDRLFQRESKSTVAGVLSEIKSLIHQYLLGLIIELAVVSGLTSIGLVIFGIQNPLLFGIITGLFNMIPYLGVLTANVLIVIIAFVTKSPVTALYVFILYLLVQFIDNNFILPKVVGSKVKINALATIITVIIGGHLCGVPGMFLSIPVMAAFKAICDKVEGLKPLGFLLADPEKKRKLIRVPGKESSGS